MTRLFKLLGTASFLASALLATTAMSQDVPTLKFIVPFGGGATYTNAGLAAVTEKVNEILVDKIGAKVNLLPIVVSDYNQRMTLMNSSREPYDIAMTAPWTNNFYSNIAQGNLLALNDYLGDVPELQKALSKQLLSVGTVDGKLYGVPVEQMFPKTFGPLINQRLTEKYKIDLSTVKTWADLTPIFETFVKGEGKGFYAAGGRLNVVPELLGYDPVIAGNVNYAVVKMDDPSLAVANIYKTQQYRDIVNLRRKWQTAGLTDPNPMNREAVRAALKAQTQAANIDQGQDRPSVQVQFGVPFVAKRFAPVVLTTASMNSAMMAISADSQHPVEALKLITLLHTDPEVYRLFAQGIEGKSYAAKTDGSGLYEKLPTASEYWPDVNWVWGNSYLALPLTAVDREIAANAKKVNAEATPSVALGFAFDVTPVESEMSAIATLLPNFEALESGQVENVNPYLDEQLAALDAAGVEKIQAELKRQLTKWQASKK